MRKWQAIERGIVLTLVTSVLWGCGGATPTPIIIVPPTTVNSAPVIPTVVQPLPTTIPPTATIAPAIPTQLTTTELATTAEVTTPTPVAPTANPLDRPFLMRIDRISVITGRGTYLEGTVARGTLRGNESVEILGPSKDAIPSTVLVVLISGTVRDQVEVGNYAGILVQNVNVTDVSPGMLLAAAGGYDTYEEATQELQ